MPSRRPAAFAHREFRLYHAGQTLSVVGDNAAPVALAFGILGAGGSAGDLGLVLAARVVALVVFMLAGGVWADRLPRRLLMLTADLVRAVAQGATAVLLIADAAPLPALVALQAVVGAGAALFRPAATGLIPTTVPPQHLQQANALLGMANSLGGAVGPAVGGILVALVGAGPALALDALTYVASALFLAAMRVPELARRATPTPFLADLAAGWGAFRSRTWLWVVVLQAALLLMVAHGPFQALGPLVAERSLGGAPAWAAILSALGVGSFAGGLLALRVRPRRPILVCALLLLVDAPVLILLAEAAPTAAIVLAMALAGVAYGLFDALWHTAVQERVPPELLSRVSAYDWMASLALLPVGLALAGPVAEAVGVRATLLGAAGIVVVVGVAGAATPGVRAAERLAPATADGASRSGRPG